MLERVGRATRYDCATTRLANNLAIAEDDFAPAQRNLRPAGHLPPENGDTYHYRMNLIFVLAGIARASSSASRPQLKTDTSTNATMARGKPSNSSN